MKNTWLTVDELAAVLKVSAHAVAHHVRLTTVPSLDV